MRGAAKSQTEKAFALLRKQGIACLSELVSAGLSPATVARRQAWCHSRPQNAVMRRVAASGPVTISW